MIFLVSVVLILIIVLETRFSSSYPLKRQSQLNSFFAKYKDDRAVKYHLTIFRKCTVHSSLRIKSNTYSCIGFLIWILGSFERVPVELLLCEYAFHRTEMKCNFHVWTANCFPRPVILRPNELSSLAFQIEAPGHALDLATNPWK